MATKVKGKGRPKTLAEIRRILKAHKAELAAQYGVQRIAVFGSYARGEATPESDLDLLVEFSPPPGLLKFIELERRLSELLGVKVELVTRNALKPHIGRRVLEEIVEV